MEIYHLALASDWAAARRSGDYRISTRGVTLEQQGFIHASRADQWPVIRERFYADVIEPLVLLIVDTEKLTSRWLVEHVPEAGDDFPHVYGPINLDAVVRVDQLGE